MTNRFWLTVVVILTLVIGVGGTTLAEPTRGGTLVAANALTLPHLDADKTTDSSVGQIMWHVYEGLVELDSSFRPVPHLAESVSVNDEGTRYVFDLRQDVVFHNGQRMTSKDVEASFQRYLDNNGAGTNMAPYIARSYADGEYRFVVEFIEPYAPFLFFLSSIVANQKFVVRPADIRGSLINTCD